MKLLALLPAASAVLLSEAPAGTPGQVHLAYTSDPTSMSITWTARPETPCTKPVVRYGYGDSDDVVAASTLGYATTNDTIFTATMTGLDGDAVCYQVGCSETDQFSDPQTFYPLPTDGDSFAFIAFGDMGVSTAAKSTVANMAADLAKNE